MTIPTYASEITSLDERHYRCLTCDRKYVSQYNDPDLAGSTCQQPDCAGLIGIAETEGIRPATSGEGALYPADALRAAYEHGKRDGEGAAGYHGRMLNIPNSEPRSESAERHYGYSAGHRAARYAAADVAAEADARITELEAQLKAANERAEDWRAAHERAAVIAADELAKQKEAYEKQLTEANARAEKAIETLKRVEWVSNLEYCPWCGRQRAGGHTLSCPRQAALRPSGEAKEGESK